MRPRRGEIWTIKGPVPGAALVVSGNLYNDLPDQYVLAMEVAAGRSEDVTVVDIGAGQTVLVDTIGRVPKRLLVERLTKIDTQQLTDVNTSLFKILATE